MAVWVCARCQRRVPSYVATCHCGAARDAQPATSADERGAAEAPQGARGVFAAREVPRSVWAALGLMALLLAFGLWSAFRAGGGEGDVVPLLGYVDRLPPPMPAPPASPSPTPEPSPAAR